MTKISDLFLWLKAFSATSFVFLLVYPFYVLKNTWYHLSAPSVMLYAAVFFALDRVSKMVVLAYSHNLPILVREFESISTTFTLTYVKNPGVAFGWFPDWRLPPIIMALVMIVIIAYYSFQLPAEEKMTRWALALLVGGAMGNLYDRVAYGFVVDFLFFRFGSFNFPVFNFADVAIDLGVFLLFVDIFFLSTDEDEENSASPESAVPAV